MIPYDDTIPHDNDAYDTMNVDIMIQFSNVFNVLIVFLLFGIFRLHGILQLFLSILADLQLLRQQLLRLDAMALCSEGEIIRNVILGL